MIRVAIVEDDPIMCGILCDAVDACADMQLVAQEENATTASVMIQAGGYDVLLCELGLPDGTGLDLVRQETRIGRDTDIMVITVFANQKNIIDGIQAGARGYLLKDEEVEDCIEAIQNIRRGGSPISPIIARQLLLHIEPDVSDDQEELAAPLTDREYEILNLLSRGFSNADCAEVLSISTNTVGTHIKNIYRQLEVNNRAEALFEASTKGWLQKSQGTF